MSNEELVKEIQSGNFFKMEELWFQVKNFVAWKAKRVMTYVENHTHAEMDDLMQSGYLALVEAVNTYTPGRSTFLNWFHFHLQNTFAEVTGYRTKKARYEPSRSPLSLDTAIGEDGNSTYSEITPDPSAEAAIEAVNTSIWHQQLHSAEMELLAELRQDQREMLMLYFFEGCNYEECDSNMGLPAGRSRALMQSGMRELRKPINKHKLRSFQEFDYFRGSGLSTFKHTGISVQERYLIKTEEEWK